MADYDPPPRERPAGRKHGTKNKFSSATIARDIQEMALCGLSLAGGAKYFQKVAQTHPGEFLNFIGRFAAPKDNSGNAGGLTFQVVNLVGNGTPTPGVLHSPIVTDIAPQRPLRLVETTDGGTP
jgi:hypothetical protein